VTRLSIGARWTLRFAAALLVAVSLFAGFSYVRIEAGMLQDAKLIHTVKGVGYILEDRSGEILAAAG